MGRYPISVVKFPYIFLYNVEGLMIIYSACLFITKNNILLLESLQFEALVKIIAVTYTYYAHIRVMYVYYSGSYNSD